MKQKLRQIYCDLSNGKLSQKEAFEKVKAIKLQEQSKTIGALLVTSVNEHRAILDAIGSRNAVQAAEALRQHVLMSRERTIRNYVKYSKRVAP